MPRYFFHVSHLKPRVNDVEGVDLPDQKAAWDEATRACGEMITEIDGNLAQGTDWRMDVTTEHGPVFEIHFGARNIVGAGGSELDDLASQLRELRSRLSALSHEHPMFDLEGLLAVAAGEMEKIRAAQVTLHRSRLAERRLGNERPGRSPES